MPVGIRTSASTAAGMQPVTSYVVYHEVGGTTEIVIYVQSGIGYSHQKLSNEQAQHLLDILRNEKPLYYDPSKKALKTGYEPPGEAE